MSDYIKREDVIDIIEEVCPIYRNDYRYILKDKIADLPSADVVERERGEWIDEADKYDASFGIHDYRCSNCNSYADEHIGGHEWYTMLKPNFCPNCGADMRV